MYTAVIIDTQKTVSLEGTQGAELPLYRPL